MLGGLLGHGIWQFGVDPVISNLTGRPANDHFAVKRAIRGCNPDPAQQRAADFCDFIAFGPQKPDHGFCIDVLGGCACRKTCDQHSCGQRSANMTGETGALSHTHGKYSRNAAARWLKSCESRASNPGGGLLHPPQKLRKKAYNLGTIARYWPQVVIHPRG